MRFVRLPGKDKSGAVVKHDPLLRVDKKEAREIRLPVNYRKTCHPRPSIGHEDLHNQSLLRRNAL